MMRTSLLLPLIGMSFLAAYGQAQKDNLEEALQKAKDEYRAKLDESEVRLILALEQRIESARKAGDKKTLDQARAERDQFEADGKLPKIVEKATQTFQRQTATAKKKLELVYRSQIKEYVKRSEDAKADELQKELDALGQRETEKNAENAKADDVKKEPDALEKRDKEEKGSRELIRNGGFEERLDDPKSKWMVVKGKWEHLMNRKDHTEAHSGRYYIWPTDSPEAELMQEVPIGQFAKDIDAGKMKFVFTGYVRGNIPDSSDSSRIIIELRGYRQKLMATIDSGEVFNFEDWQKIEFSKPIKEGTLAIRVRLLSERHKGNESNSYFDSLSLTVVPNIKSEDDGAKKNP